MDTNALNLFDKIYLVNLKRRPDRLDEFYKNNAAYVKNLDIEVFEAIEGKLVQDDEWKFNKGALGCWKSHIELLKIIEKSDFDKVLILEDDALIVDKKSLECEEVKNFIIEEKWDMFYFGFEHFKPPSLLSENIQKLNWALQTHAYAVNRASVSKIIRYAEMRKYWIDGIFAEIHSFMNCYATTKNTIIQTASKSDITPKTTFWRILYLKASSILRKMLKMIKKFDS
ncbi:glycosyltransferase family 25 protein [Pedobacter aquatilis]|uniref:glycosyltransferase family 25 protein n=1 Tax=Pedobacter aquatilis TaxID=351343 RepID=UPI00292FE1CB|nr:glycosyltransferase family 25 protein [Pedobacter aquatilis]